MFGFPCLKIYEYDNCSEIRLIGICHDCKLIVDCSPIRYYDDGRFLIYNEEIGWFEGHHGIIDSVWHTIVEWFKSLFKRSKK